MKAKRQRFKAIYMNQETNYCNRETTW